MPAALGVPDDTGAAVGGDGGLGGAHGRVDGDVLVRLGELDGIDGTGGRGGVGKEVGDEIKETDGLEGAVEHPLQRPPVLPLLLTEHDVVLVGVPGGHVLPRRERGAEAGSDPVGGEGEEERGEGAGLLQLTPVALELVVRGTGAVVAVGLLQLQDGDGKAVDIQHDVEDEDPVLGTAHPHLGGGEEVVAVGVSEVDGADGGVPCLAAFGVVVGDADAVCEPLVEAVVLPQIIPGVPAQQLVDGVLGYVLGQARVTVPDRLEQPGPEDQVVPIGPNPVRGPKLRSRNVLPPVLTEQFERMQLQLLLGEPVYGRLAERLVGGCGHTTSSTARTASFTRSFPERS